MKMQNKENIIQLKKLYSLTFCEQNVYNKRVHHEYIFQTMFLACPKSLLYTFNKCSPEPVWFITDINREK